MEEMEEMEGLVNVLTIGLLWFTMVYYGLLWLEGFYRDHESSTGLGYLSLFGDLFQFHISKTKICWRLHISPFLLADMEDVTMGNGDSSITPWDLT